jgi:hypothetical protein
MVTKLPTDGVPGFAGLPKKAKPVGNLFDTARAGRAVVRPDDLLALRFELINLEVVAGSPPRVRRKGTAPAFLVLHFPPQSIAEEVFFQTQAQGVDPNASGLKPPPKGSARPDETVGTGADPLDPPPVRARAAGESRVVFEWPADLKADYTVAGLLAAVEQLTMKVPAAALPREAAASRTARPAASASPWWLAPALAAPVARKGSKKAARGNAQALALGSFNLRQALIARQGGPAAQATLLRRLADIAPIAKLIVPGHVSAAVRPRAGEPKPALPSATETALELPWRLIIAPHAGERWRHATQALPSSATQRTELWHSRLIGSDAGDARPLHPPHADPQRSVRAVWATTGPTGRAMKSDWPNSGDLPAPAEGDPFLTTLNDYDRHQISHLSANFSIGNYQPTPIDTRLLMLSALGGWLDSRGAWDAPGLDLEEWTHRASMGRDHYVRVVYRGVLFPFGHRAALIKVSERRFHRDAPGGGNTAYLRQRMFLVVRQRVRDYSDAGSLMPYGTGIDRVKNEFPLTQVRMLTTVTPDLDNPNERDPSKGVCDVAGQGQLLFWPTVRGEPFRFRMSATDLDNRNVEFELPLIFMANSKASPREADTDTGVLRPNYESAAAAAELALEGENGWQTKQPPDAKLVPRPDRAVAQTQKQRVAMAPSHKSGDTSIEAVSITFDAHVPKDSASIKAFSDFSRGLDRPMFFPRIAQAQARIAALAQLSGSDKLNLVRWNPTYAELGFDVDFNKGQVFVDVVPATDMAQLDFSKQGDRSGGFVMPNLTPSAISRALGPVAGKVDDVLQGKINPTEFFPKGPGGLNALPLPLLFGCIPLSDVIEEVKDLAGDLGKAPKFVSEATGKIEAFFNDLTRLYQFVSALVTQPATLADAALAVIKSTLNDLVAQAKAYAAGQLAHVAANVDPVLQALDKLSAEFVKLAKKDFKAGDPLAGIDLTTRMATFSSTLKALRVAVNTPPAPLPALPAGFVQSVNAVVGQAQTMLEGLDTLAMLYSHGKTLFDALADLHLLDNDKPGESFGDLLTKPDDLKKKLERVRDALGDVRTDVATFALLDGAPRKAIVSVIDTVAVVLGNAAKIADLLNNLFGEELVVRFDWKPEIKNWPIKDPLFVVHDKNAFTVSVVARVKKSGGPAKVQVLCSLHHFDLVLIAPASFIELNFEKIEFTVDSSAKMNVDVKLTAIKFVGPLSFVEVLRDLIPLDGFSDPPYLDISTKGIDAGFSLALPSIGMGLFNLSNVSLGAGFTVPFIGQPLALRFNFCTREQPFQLVISLFGGGGFFGITLGPKGVQVLEAAFEFGACVCINLGVASGGVSVMAGIYFRLETTSGSAELTGYFRLEGHVSVLGILSISIELYLALSYNFDTGKAVGLARLTVEVSVFMFSFPVTITCERKFAGSNGDPTFRQVMGTSSDSKLALTDELNAIVVTPADATKYAWRDYCEAFA